MRKDFTEFPLWQKGYEILNMVIAIRKAFAERVEDDEMLKSSLDFIYQDALQIPAKIAGAYNIGLYDLKMENAAIIRKCARDVYVHSGSLGHAKIGDEDYIRLLRSTIEDEFRPMFAEWVTTFDINDYTIDRWGLFNPPGVNYDDHDPDDDIPFDAEKFIEEMGYWEDEEDEGEEWKDLLDDED